MNPQPFDLNELVQIGGPAQAEANAMFYLAHLGSEGWYTLETYGPANIAIGLWGPFDDPIKAVAQAPYGRMQVEGIGCWSCQKLAAGYWLLRITQMTPGQFSFKLRDWQFGDQVQVATRGSH